MARQAHQQDLFLNNDNLEAMKASNQHFDNPINRFMTNGSIAIPMETFEKMYLNPETRVKGEPRKNFANTTPLALMGFLLASAPLGCALMGWRGSGGGGAATIGVFYFFGLLQIIGSVMERIIGNTFPFVVFGYYGAFWLALAATLQPAYNAQGAYTSGLTGAELAAGKAEFLSSFAFFILFVGVLTFLYLLCAFRTNIVFVFIFFFLDIALFLLAGAYWVLEKVESAKGARLEVVAGAFVFAFCMLGFYLLFAQLLQALDLPSHYQLETCRREFRVQLGDEKPHETRFEL